MTNPASNFGQVNVTCQGNQQSTPESSQGRQAECIVRPGSESVCAQPLAKLLDRPRARAAGRDGHPQGRNIQEMIATFRPPDLANAQNNHIPMQNAVGNGNNRMVDILATVEVARAIAEEDHDG